MLRYKQKDDDDILESIVTKAFEHEEDVISKSNDEPDWAGSDEFYENLFDEMKKTDW